MAHEQVESQRSDELAGLGLGFALALGLWTFLWKWRVGQWVRRNLG